MPTLAQRGYVTLVALEARARASRRYELGDLIDRRIAASALNPEHSILPELDKKISLLYRQCLNQELNRTLGFRFVQQSAIVWSTQFIPQGAPCNFRISRGMLLDDRVMFPELRGHLVLRNLDAHTSKLPTLPRHPSDVGFFAMSSTYPRAKALCYLHAIVNTGTYQDPVFTKTTLALDRAGGRLHLLATLLSKVDTGVSVAINTPEHPGLYPCSQLLLSNFP